MLVLGIVKGRTVESGALLEPGGRSSPHRRGGLRRPEESRIAGAMPLLSPRLRRSEVIVVWSGTRSAASGARVARWSSAPATRISGGPSPARSNAGVVPSRMSPSPRGPFLLRSIPATRGDGDRTAREHCPFRVSQRAIRVTSFSGGYLCGANIRTGIHHSRQSKQPKH